jgi:pimeloyl-ACP methyl ester carboxylesterase
MRRTVRSGDVDVAVWQSGNPANPTIVAVHGFPDDHRLWDRLTARLVDRFHVVAYDVRGAGQSSAPAKTNGYCLERLTDDLVAVLDATLPPAGRAHLVGHDWGSTQLWEPVTREATDWRLTGRIASFTSISGPSLDHLARFFRVARSPGRIFAVAQQAVRSSYVGFFQLPVLPELVLRPIAGRNGVNGVNLYRANIAARMRTPREATTHVPVQLLVLTGDVFLSPAVFDGIERWAPRLHRVDVDAGHWAPRTQPDGVGTLVADFIDRIEAGPR